MAPGSLLTTAAQAPPPDPNATHLFMIGDWGTDRYVPQQVSVSQSMQTWMDQHHVAPNAMVLLGDNWYGKMHGGVNDHRWNDQFENMYPASKFPGPAFAVLGNHDYEKGKTDKVAIQLDYPKQRKTRWTMPNRWYSMLYPQQNPVAKFIFLDSNLPGTKPFDPWPWSYLMSHEDADAQDQWFRAELAKPREAPFLIVVCHHPLFTNGVHRDNPLLIKRWEPLIRQARVDFWITGHDHDLQHIEFAGDPGPPHLVRHLRRRRRRTRRLVRRPRQARPLRRQGPRLFPPRTHQGSHYPPPHHPQRPGTPHLPQNARR